ncbi:MAG: tRNA pseudouridine(55) synthase TruB [Dehalococcoidia bacterium]|nr:tRNA pseudouridine(55) synthase TruB [Dehalococcoidia bacterium]
MIAAPSVSVVGILNVNKPPGKTSFDIVALIRRLAGERRVGHAGTLDPMATGVLPVCLNQATRVIEYLQEQPKTYLAEIELGTVTDTYDGAGKVIRKSSPVAVTLGRLEEELQRFRGTIEQRPPMYSAVRYQGRHLYELARAGMEVERQPREVQLYSVQLVKFELPLLTLEVVCGKGTYLRSIAHELGQALGCGAYLKHLSRLKYGPFAIDDALTLSSLEEAFRQGHWQGLLYPMSVALGHCQSFTVGEEAAVKLRNGRALPLTAVSSAAYPALSGVACAYTEGRCLIAVLSLDVERQEWRPKKVFPVSG